MVSSLLSGVPKNGDGQDGRAAAYEATDVDATSAVPHSPHRDSATHLHSSHRLVDKQYHAGGTAHASPNRTPASLT
jgi:hypothetical protein